MAEKKNGERGSSEYAKKDGEQPKRKPGTRFVFKLAAFVLLLFVAYVVWFFIRTNRKPEDIVDLLNEKKRAELLEQVVADYRTAAHAGDEVCTWAQKEFKDWEHALSQRLKSAPPKTKEESAALVKETQEKLEKPPAALVPADTTRPAGTADKKAEPVTSKPPANPSLAKASDEYGNGCKAYAMTDPAAPQQQVQKYLRLAAGHFETCLYWVDKARAEKVAENVLDPYEQPATKRLYDCRKRMELTR